MRHAIWVLAVVAVCLPLRSHAYEANVSIGGGVEYVGNVFRTERDVQDDWKFGITPSIRLSNARRRLNWSFAYKPGYSRFFEFNQRNDWTQDFSLRGDYSFSPRTRVSFLEAFTLQSFDAARSFNEANPDLAPDDQQDNFRSLRNRINVALAHQINRRLSSSANLGYLLRRFDNPRDADSNVFSASGRLSYMAFPRGRIGIGASYSLASFDDRFVVNALDSANRSQTINGFVSGSYQLSPTSALSFSAGPAYIIQRPEAPPAEIRRYPNAEYLIKDPDGPGLIPDPDQPAGPRFLNLDTCSPVSGTEYRFPCSPGVDGAGDPVNNQVVVITPPSPPNQVAPGFNSPEEMAAETFVSDAAQVRRQNNLTWFASGSLSKNWEKVSTSISYRRSESPSSTFGTSTVVDSLSARISFVPVQQWRMSLSGGWTQRSSVGDSVNIRSSGFVLGDSGARGTAAYDPGPPPTGIIDTRIAEIIDEIINVTDNALDTTYYRANMTVSRRFWRRWQAILNVNFIAQRRGAKATNLRARQYNDYRIRLGLRYDFQPLYF